jgi:hypothetical protein
MYDKKYPTATAIIGEKVETIKPDTVFDQSRRLNQDIAKTTEIALSIVNKLGLPTYASEAKNCTDKQKDTIPSLLTDASVRIHDLSMFLASIDDRL